MIKKPVIFNNINQTDLVKKCINKLKQQNNNNLYLLKVSF